MLYGRDKEQNALVALVDRAHTTGCGAVVSLHGEPGIGKTALLDHLAAAVSETSVLRATSAEAEADFGYATLHQLLLPVLDRVDRLPAPQSSALGVVFGLAAGPAPESFLVGLATLSLLSELASGRPVVCLVDDVQWIDRASARVLEFVGRRLDSEPIVLVLSSRTSEQPSVVVSGAVDMPLEALERGAAMRLLSERTRSRLSRAQRELVLEATAGNPLAIIELPVGAIPHGPSLSAPVLLADTLREAFLARVLRHTPSVGRLLLLVAAAGHIRRDLLASAAAEFDAAPTAELGTLDELIETDTGAIAFRHPLIRAAVYHGAAASDRRAAHRALAAVLTSAADLVRCAWHLGQAVDGPDDEVADRIERAGRGIQVSTATAAALLARAGDLSTGGPRRYQRYLESAVAWFHSGDADRAALMLELIDREGPPEESLRRDVLWLRSLMELHTGTPSDAMAMLGPLMPAIVEADPQQAILSLIVWEEASFHANLPTEWSGLAEIVERLSLSDNSSHDALLRLFRGACRARTGRPHKLSSADLDAVEAFTDPAMLLGASGMLRSLGERDRGRRLNRTAVRHARDTGAVIFLIWALERSVIDDLASGRLRSAGVSAEEGHRLADEIGLSNASCWYRSTLALLAALEGRDQNARDLADEALAEAIPRRLAVVVTTARRALGLIDLVAGRPDSALTYLQSPSDFVHPGVILMSAPDLVEAAVQAGKRDLATKAFASLRQAASTGAPEPSALVARCEALLAEPEDAEGAFDRALELHGYGDQPIESARTRLLYGEYLRRRRRRTEARRPLREAFETFQSLGASAWADRARAELRAAGEIVEDPARSSEVEMLTPQEVRIAQAVAQGYTNREIAAQMFLGARTIDYHLRKIFNKLDIGSRADLIRVILTGRQR
ncbi:AAA family ATPase [Nocardia wallacei]|uniref:AAA family ATPase n=1 Tax=Nocardia wallacei TaxID=480035 RepID=UPI002457A635|nr:LuxR family transcriptional regulator [Nocardia wallacei]